MAITRTSLGALFSSAAAGTATFGAGATAGDSGILVEETANQTASAPTGWTSTAAAAGFGTAGLAGASQAFIFTRQSITSGEVSTGISVSDSGDHQNAVLLSYSGLDPTTPFVVSGINGSSSATVSVAAGGLAAANVKAGDTVLAIICTDRDSATASTNTAGAWAGITGTPTGTFIFNQSSATAAGGGIIINELAVTADATGTVTFTCTITSSAYNAYVLVLKAPPTGTTVSPSAGHLTLAGHQSTVALQVAPSAGHITLGGKIPTLTVGTSLTPVKGGLVLTGHQPSSSLNVGISPSAGHLALGGKVPTVTKNFAVSSTAGHIALGGKVPAVSINFAVSASTGHLTLGGKLPTVTKNFVIGPSVGHLSLGGKIPSITIASGLAPSTGHLALTGKVPAVTLALNPATGHIAFAGHASNIGLQVNATVGHLQFGGGVPLVSASSGITPLVAHLALSGNVPTLTFGAAALGHIKVDLGSFIAKPVKVWDGSAWVVKPLKYWTGSTWRPTGF